jgi:uncharacterized membrane protein YtjA (UPF0391 family)
VAQVNGTGKLRHPRNVRLRRFRTGNLFDLEQLTQGTTSDTAMLHLVITLLIIALIAGLLGFGGIAGTAVGLAKIIFFVALVLFLVSLNPDPRARSGHDIPRG